MFGKLYRLSLLSVVLVAGAACNQPLTTTGVQETRMEEARSRPQAHFTHMVDNAIAQDMSIADFHFVVHTSELSGAGVNRLDRMAPFLSTYGGTVRYETFITNEELIKQRLEHVREYLAMIDCDMSRVDVTTMISGGRGMPARKAIENEERGTQPEGQEDSSLSGLLGSAGGGS